MAEQTHPGVDGFQIHEDGSMDIFLIKKKRQRKERLQKLFDRVDNAKKPITFSSEGSPGASGTGFDFSGDVDSPESRTEKPEDDDTILREVVGDDANDKKRQQELIEQELDKFRNC